MICIQRLTKKKSKANREAFILKLMTVLGIGSFITAAVLLTLVFILQIDKVRARYDQYLVMLQNFQGEVTSLNNPWLIVIVIFLLYLLRSLTAIYPYPILYICTAMVFSPVNSFIINMAGMLFTVAFRYFTGVQMGEGMWNAILKKYPTTSALFEVDGKGNPLVLFTLRFVPVVPCNTVSHLYGSFEYPFVKYLLISMGAMAPRLISYSFIGKNVYDPLSVTFFVPLTLLFVLTGVSFFLLRGMLAISFRSARKAREKREHTDEMISILDNMERIDSNE